MNRFLLILPLALVLAACGTGNSSQGNEQAKSEPVVIPVEVASAREGTVVALYSATATLTADREARVVPRLGGQVIELAVEEGDQVRTGDVLARIDDDRFRLQLARAESDLSRLRQDYQRHQEMHQRQLISTEVFERLKYEFEAQQAQVELVRLELSHTAITAPIDGVVTERMVKVGNTVDTTQPVFVITAMEPLLATLHVPERELARMRVGQPAMMQADAMPGEQFAGHVQRIAPVIDSASGTFRVTVELGGHDGQLRPGMFGRFHIVHDQREHAILVPAQAVLAEDGRHSVFVVNSDQAERRRVKVGYRNNGEYEILEGLERGDRVVVTGQAALRSGSTVAVLNEEPAESDRYDGHESALVGPLSSIAAVELP
jgi:membrane fusion protein, multidrug efflux system